MADQDTNWTWNFTGPTTESKAQSRAILPKEISWELTGVDGNEVGGLRTHPGFKNICTFTTGSETLVNVFPLALLTSAEAFVCGHIYFTTTGGNTRGYIQVTSDGITYYTSAYTADLGWTGTGLEITVECIGRFAYIFVKGQNPKSLRITNVAVNTATNFVVQDGGPGTAPEAKIISTPTDDKYADYIDTTKNPAGSRTGGSPTYPQDMHVYRAGGANSGASPNHGTGATATAVLGTGGTSDKVVSATITNSGSGYITVPTVTFSAPPSGVTATGTAVTNYNTAMGPNNDASWRVTGITIVNQGSGYSSAPTITIGGDSLAGSVGAPIKLPIGDYSFAVQYMSTVTGRKSVISNVKILKVATVPTTSTGASTSREEYLRLKVFNFGTSGEYDKALIYRSVKNAGEGGTLHLEKTLSLPAAATIYSVTQATTTVTIVTVAAHGLQVGDFVTVAAVTSTSINGSFAIASITNSTTFTYTTTSGTITTTLQGGSITLKVRNYDVEVPDMELVYLDVYIDKGNMDKTMPRGSVAAFMGSTLFVSRIGGADVGTPDDITPQSPPRAVGDLRWSSTGEIQPENFRPSNRWIPRTPGNEIIGMRTVGNYMMAFSPDRAYRIGRAGQFIKVEEVHLGYGLAGVDALEGVGGMVYFVSGGGVKAISAEGKIDDVAGLDALVNRLWLGQKSQIKMGFDAIGQCLTIMKPPTVLGVADGAAVCMWFGTNRITELTDLPFHYVRSGAHIVGGQLQRRAVFYKRTSTTAWGAYIVDHERNRGTGLNLCGGTARFVTGAVTPTVAEFDCACYGVVSGTKTAIASTAGSTVYSVAPILFRWVGGNVGSQADPGQPEYKDFFRQKQLSTASTYFEVVSVGALPATNATWRALAYRGTEETAMSTAVPTTRTGLSPNTFTVGDTNPELTGTAPFGKHGIMWSTLSVGFQCDIVGVDLRLLAFNAAGKVLDTTRRYV